MKLARCVIMPGITLVKWKGAPNEKISRAIRSWPESSQPTLYPNCAVLIDEDKYVFALKERLTGEGQKLHSSLDDESIVLTASMARHVTMCLVLSARVRFKFSDVYTLKVGMDGRKKTYQTTGIAHYMENSVSTVMQSPLIQGHRDAKGSEIRKLARTSSSRTQWAGSG